MKDLSDLNIGDEVWCGGDSGFCTSETERVEFVTFRFDTYTGEKYKVAHLKEGRTFDCRNGNALNPPMAYYIRALK